MIWPVMKALVKKIKMHGVRKLVAFAVIELRAKFFRLFYGSFSQAQEDLMIDKLLGKKLSGFFVDIGASDSIRYSNTHYFYLKGWRGINIEPDSANYFYLIKNRKHDINLNVGISKKKSQEILFRFTPAVLSTFSGNVTNEFKNTGYDFIGTEKVQTDTLTSVLNKNAANKVIDFFSIDTEGYDFVVLKSNNWNKYKPKIICIESEDKHEFEGKTKENEIHQFLTKLNYQLIYNNRINRIYQLR